MAKTAREDPLGRAVAAVRESKSVEFKEKFDPANEGEWIELIKDFAAVANSGGGVLVIGVKDNGEHAGQSVKAVLELDAAKIADKLMRYTGENFDGFEIHAVKRKGKTVAAIAVSGVTDAPLVFKQPGSYKNEQGKPKTAFVRGAAYFRHGAKSEPCTTDDLRQFIERRLETIRSAWMGGIRKVVTAPEDFELARVRATDEEGTPTRIQLTTDPHAPIYGRLSHDETHPYRLTEMLKELKERVGRSFTEYDIRTLRHAHEIDEKASPQFCVQPKYSSMQYSDAFIDWVVEQYEHDPTVFSKARQAYYEQTHLF